MKNLLAPALFALLLPALPALANSPACNGPNETKLSWPADEPVWEMCWLRPSHSSGPQGSGMELRDVHYNGISVLKTAHSPLLFAEYASSTCYRDWKDANNSFVAEVGVRNQLGMPQAFTATTSCDRSTQPNTSYGQCPYQLPGMTSANCFQGLSLEDMGDHVVLTTHYEAAWYAYTSRAVFYLDGAFDLRFGFGNFSNTSNSTTHWHHNYWRLDFDIDGADNNVLSINDVVQNVEFTSLRDATGGPGGVERTWEVRNSQTGRGYRIIPSEEDYVTPTNESGRGFHMTDVIGTVYVPGEYGDLANNPIGACGMSHNNLANGQNLAGPNGTGTDVVLYYRSAVKDTAGVDAMICKSAGPMFVPLGDWGNGKPIPEEADLSIAVMADPDPVAAGATLHFHITVANAGPRAVDEAQVALQLPPELSLDQVRGGGAATWLCGEPALAGEGMVICSMTSGQVAADAQSIFTVQLQVDANAPNGEVESTASVESDQWTDPSAENNSVLVTTMIEGIDLDTIFAHDFECHKGSPGCL